MCWLLALALTSSAAWLLAAGRGLVESGGDAFQRGVVALMLFAVSTTGVVVLAIAAFGTAILGPVAKVIPAALRSRR